MEEKPLDWRQVVQIIKTRGQAYLAAQAFAAANDSFAAMAHMVNASPMPQPAPSQTPQSKPAKPSVTLEPTPFEQTATPSGRSQDGPPSSEKASSEASQTTPSDLTKTPSEMPQTTPPEPTDENPFRRRKKKKKKQQGEMEPEQMEPRSTVSPPIPVQFVFTAGTQKAESASGVGEPASFRTVPKEGDWAEGLERTIRSEVSENDREATAIAANGEGQEGPQTLGQENSAVGVSSQDANEAKEAPAESKKKTKKKKKKGKGGGAGLLEGGDEVSSSINPPAANPGGLARGETNVEGGAKTEQGGREGGLGSTTGGDNSGGEFNAGERGSKSEAAERSTSEESEKIESPSKPEGAEAPDLSNEWPSEEPTGWAEPEEDVPDFVSDSDGEASAADDSDWEDHADEEDDWEKRADLVGDEEKGAPKPGAEWGELEEDDVEQLLMLGQIQHGTEAPAPWKSVPTRKKRPSATAPAKSTPATQTKAPNVKPPPSVSFRPPGSPSEHIELHLPAGRLVVNRADFDPRPAAARFFVIKSNSVDDVHKSIKYGVWASTATGNKRLHEAFKEATQQEPPCQVFLFFSVNASGQFCGVAEMMSDVDFSQNVDVWAEDKVWTGRFRVHWHIIKDVPNREFWHIRVPANDNKPVTNSRDTQDVPYEQGLEVLAIFNAAPSLSSILDYFKLYDTRQALLQEERDMRARQMPPPGMPDAFAYRGEAPGPHFRPRPPEFMGPPFLRHVPFNVKTKLCQRYESPQGCNYGDRCMFAHGVQDLRPHPPPGVRQPFFFPRPHFRPDSPFFPGPPQFRNGFFPRFEGPRPPPWAHIPPHELESQWFGHPHPRGIPSFQTPGQEIPDPCKGGVEYGGAEEGVSDSNGGAFVDEKEAQDEYLLQLLTANGDSEKGGSAPGVEDDSGFANVIHGEEWAGGLEHQEDEEVCCICFERPMDAILVPCSHALCRQCAELMQSARSSCPMCNKEIEGISVEKLSQ